MDLNSVLYQRATVDSLFFIELSQLSGMSMDKTIRELQEDLIYQTSYVLLCFSVVVSSGLC